MQRWIPFKSRAKDAPAPTSASDIPPDAKLREELSGLVAAGEPAEVTEALTEAKEALSKATKSDIYGIKLMESGRCPQCQSRTNNFLYSIICESCGWSHRRVPDTGRCIVHLVDKRTIECDRVFPIQNGQFLCVTGGIVRHHLMAGSIQHIEHVWTDEELAAARERAMKLIRGACSWCEKELSGEDESYVDFVAFGMMQERYVFCSESCMRQFRKQSPSRIHRNCYETDCRKCNQCIKRYDVTGFKRHILA